MVQRIQGGIPHPLIPETEVQEGRDLAAVLAISLGSSEQEVLEHLKRLERDRPPPDGYHVGKIHLDTAITGRSPVADPSARLRSNEKFVIARNMDLQAVVKDLDLQPHLVGPVSKLGARAGRIRTTAEGAHLPEVGNLKAAYDVPTLQSKIHMAINDSELSKLNTRRADEPRVTTIHIVGPVGGTQGAAPVVFGLTDYVLSALGVPANKRWDLGIWIEPDPADIGSIGLRNCYGTRAELLKLMELRGVTLPRHPALNLAEGAGRFGVPHIIFLLGCIDLNGERKLSDHHDVLEATAHFVYYFSNTGLSQAMFQAILDREAYLRPSRRHEDPAFCSVGVQVWHASGEKATEHLAATLGANYLAAHLGEDLSQLDHPEHGPVVRGIIDRLRDAVRRQTEADPAAIVDAISPQLQPPDPPQWLAAQIKERNPRTRLLWAECSSLVADYQARFTEPGKRRMANSALRCQEEITERFREAVANQLDIGAKFDHLAWALAGDSAVDGGPEQEPQTFLSLLRAQEKEAGVERERRARQARELDADLRRLSRELQESSSKNRGRKSKALVAQLSDKWAQTLQASAAAARAALVERVLDGLATTVQVQARTLEAQAERLTRSIRDLDAKTSAPRWAGEQSLVEQMVGKELLNRADLSRLYDAAIGHSMDAGITPAIKEDIERHLGSPSQWRRLEEPDLVSRVTEACRTFFHNYLLEEKPLDQAGLSELLRWMKSLNRDPEGWEEDWAEETLKGSTPLVSVNQSVGRAMSEARSAVLVGSDDESLLHRFQTPQTRTFGIDDPTRFVVVQLLTGVPFASLTIYPQARAAYEQDPFTLIPEGDEAELRRRDRATEAEGPGGNLNGGNLAIGYRQEVP